MSRLPGDIFRRWTHSFEEDTGDIKVYRPATYDFPRARGRAGIEFRADGAFIEWLIGAGDARQGVQARWQVDPSGRVRIVFADNARAPLILAIVQVSADLLQVRQLPAGP